MRERENERTSERENERVPSGTERERVSNHQKLLAGPVGERARTRASKRAREPWSETARERERSRTYPVPQRVSASPIIRTYLQRAGLCEEVKRRDQLLRNRDREGGEENGQQKNKNMTQAQRKKFKGENRGSSPCKTLTMEDTYNVRH